MIKPSIMKNSIQKYAWGSISHIQNLLGEKDNDGTPWAELWMGAHPNAPSKIRINGDWISLDRVISENPDATIGNIVRQKFGDTLPFLFKALAAEKPLSIQAHPDKFQARQGFARENRLNIPIDGPVRNYRDDRPKPECICALTDFYALNGFRPLKEILSGLTSVCPETLKNETAAAGRLPEPEGIKFIFEHLLRTDLDRKKDIIREAVFNAAKSDSLKAKWIIRLHEEFPGDIGILAPMLLNLVMLRPGEAMFLPARRLHSYLKGFGVELMANSDNVLRGGLTPKHVDVDELLRVLDFSSSAIETHFPQKTGACEETYPQWSDAFSLSVIEPGREPGACCRVSDAFGPEILFCVKDDCILDFQEKAPGLKISRGESAFVPDCIRSYTLSGKGRIFRARVPKPRF